MNTIEFEFMTCLVDSRAVVKVFCEIDEDGDVSEITCVTFNNFEVTEILSQNQWDDLEFEARQAYKAEQDEQATIDHDLNNA